MHCLKHTHHRVLFHLFLAVMLLAPLLALGGGTAYAAGSGGRVYTQSNEADGNEILVFQRAEDGALDFAQAFETGGAGSGAGLGSQGAVILSKDGRWLFAVNAGSNEVSIFRVSRGGLNLTDVVPSGGEMPISLTYHGGLLYVLNAGGAGNIAGYRLNHKGELALVPGSIRPLSNHGAGPSPGPAQIEFTPDGRHLVVTEKMTNLIDRYGVRQDGRARGPQVFESAGITPFGFAFADKGQLIVSEAFGGEENASATSSYRFSREGLEVISASVPTHQTAACWVVITKNNRYAYTTNTGSNSISSYRIRFDGSLRLLESVAGETGAGPIDMALSPDSRLLYSLDSGSAAISGFRVKTDGGLEKIDFTAGLPASSVGLAAD
jgi:6-phosphogluconolactonase (cycloisomerase 2 family)